MIEELKVAFARCSLVREGDDGVRVTTHCLYPSNKSVNVTVRGGTTECVVSDEGGAFSEVEAMGLRNVLSEKQIVSLVKRQGLRVKGSLIYSPPVPFSAVPSAILLVANASKRVADWSADHLRVVRDRAFKTDLSELLNRYFSDAVRQTEIVGVTNKTHRFHNVIHFSHGQRIIVDAAVPDPSSVNARVAANIDVKMANDPSIDQIIVYDDLVAWRSGDLNLLSIGAPILAFSKAESYMQRVAARPLALSSPAA